MASDEEDEDLVALRTAALASVKGRVRDDTPSGSPTARDELEDDPELAALREAALQSKKQEKQAQSIAPATIPQNSVVPQVAPARRNMGHFPNKPGFQRPNFTPKGHPSTKPKANLIVIQTIPMEGESQQKPDVTGTTTATEATNLLLRPQDKWAGTDSDKSNSAPKAKTSNKFSRFESSDSESDDEDDSSNSSDSDNQSGRNSHNKGSQSDSSESDSSESGNSGKGSSQSGDSDSDGSQSDSDNESSQSSVSAKASMFASSNKDSDKRAETAGSANHKGSALKVNEPGSRQTKNATAVKDLAQGSEVLHANFPKENVMGSNVKHPVNPVDTKVPNKSTLSKTAGSCVATNQENPRDVTKEKPRVHSGMDIDVSKRDRRVETVNTRKHLSLDDQKHSLKNVSTKFGGKDQRDQDSGSDSGDAAFRRSLREVTRKDRGRERPISSQTIPMPARSKNNISVPILPTSDTIRDKSRLSHKAEENRRQHTERSPRSEHTNGKSPRNESSPKPGSVKNMSTKGMPVEKVENIPAPKPIVVADIPLPTGSMDLAKLEARKKKFASNETVTVETATKKISLQGIIPRSQRKKNRNAEESDRKSSYLKQEKDKKLPSEERKRTLSSARSDKKGSDTNKRTSQSSEKANSKKSRHTEPNPKRDARKSSDSDSSSSSSESMFSDSDSSSDAAPWRMKHTGDADSGSKKSGKVAFERRSIDIEQERRNRTLQEHRHDREKGLERSRYTDRHRNIDRRKDHGDTRERKRDSNLPERRHGSGPPERRRDSGAPDRKHDTGASEKRQDSGAVERKHESGPAERRHGSGPPNRWHDHGSSEKKHDSGTVRELPKRYQDPRPHRSRSRDSSSSSSDSRSATPTVRSMLSSVVVKDKRSLSSDRTPPAARKAESVRSERTKGKKQTESNERKVSNSDSVRVVIQSSKSDLSRADARNAIRRLKRKPHDDGSQDGDSGEEGHKKTRDTSKGISSPVINITFNKEVNLEKSKSKGRLPVHERLGLPVQRHERSKQDRHKAEPKVYRRVIEESPVPDKPLFKESKFTDSEIVEKETKRKSEESVPVTSKKRVKIVRNRGGIEAVSTDKKKEEQTKDVDEELEARIKMIQEKNAAIMKRRQEIEADKEKYG